MPARGRAGACVPAAAGRRRGARARAFARSADSVPAADRREGLRFAPGGAGDGSLRRDGGAGARGCKWCAQNEPVLVIASSDMNHYESDEITRRRTSEPSRACSALDPRGLYDTVRNEGITMCGYAATVAMLVAMRELGAKDAKLSAMHLRGRFRRPRASGRVRRDRHLITALTPGEDRLSRTRRRVQHAVRIHGSARFPPSTSVA